MIVRAVSDAARSCPRPAATAATRSAKATSRPPRPARPRRTPCVIPWWRPRRLFAPGVSAMSTEAPKKMRTQNTATTSVLTITRGASAFSGLTVLAAGRPGGGGRRLGREKGDGDLSGLDGDAGWRSRRVSEGDVGVRPSGCRFPGPQDAEDGRARSDQRGEDQQPHPRPDRGRRRAGVIAERSTKPYHPDGQHDSGEENRAGRGQPSGKDTCRAARRVDDFGDRGGKQ